MADVSTTGELNPHLVAAFDRWVDDGRRLDLAVTFARHQLDQAAAGTNGHLRGRKLREVQQLAADLQAAVAAVEAHKAKRPLAPFLGW